MQQGHETNTAREKQRSTNTQEAETRGMRTADTHAPPWQEELHEELDVDHEEHEEEDDAAMRGHHADMQRHCEHTQTC